MLPAWGLIKNRKGSQKRKEVAATAIVDRAKGRAESMAWAGVRSRELV